MSDRLVWIDCEMTGLDLGADALIEVAALVTDFDLNVLGEGVDIVIKPSQESLDQMVEFVKEMHTTSGLIDVLADGTTLADAEAQVLAYVKEHCEDGSRPPLAGNTVATDRAFLARDMPELEQRIHRLAALSIGLAEIIGAPQASYAISAPALHALVQAASMRVRDPLVELFDPLGPTPQGADWTRQLVGLARAAIENRCGLIFCVTQGFF